MTGFRYKSILLTALVSGISVFVNKQFVTTGDPVAFAFLRNSLTAILALILLLPRIKTAFTSVSLRQMPALAILGLTGGGLSFALFFSGLSMIGASAGNAIHKSMFIWVYVISSVFCKFRPKPVQILGVVAVFFGVYISGFPTAGIFKSYGSLLVLGATLIWSVENIMAKNLLMSVKPELLALSRMLFGLPVLLVLALKNGSLDATVATTGIWNQIVVSSLFLIMYMHFWYLGLRKTNVGLATAILALAPFITLALESLSSGKTISPGAIGQYILIAGGIILLSGKTNIFKLYKHGH